MKVTVSMTGLKIELDTETATPLVTMSMIPLLQKIIESPNVGEYREAWLDSTKVTPCKHENPGNQA